jgi:hypothetical protein
VDLNGSLPQFLNPPLHPKNANWRQLRDGYWGLSKKPLAVGEIKRLRSRISEAEGYFAMIDTALLASIAQQMISNRADDADYLRSSSRISLASRTSLLS